MADFDPALLQAAHNDPRPNPWRTVFDNMKAARRWLLAAPDKVPFYANGQKRHGTLDSPDDLAKLATYAAAKAALSAKPTGWLLGFALGPDGTGLAWQGVDFDSVRANHLGQLADAVAGYVEFSPSGEGAHAIGYGRPFATLGSNRTGIEAYASGRYFTVTENLIRDDELVCLADYVEQVLALRHGAKHPLAASAVAPTVSVDAQTVAHLRSALNALRADDHAQWVAVGHALKELGDVGRGLWLDWSQSSDSYNPAADPKQWDTFHPKHTGYQAVFKRAQDAGWTNPMSKAAQLDQGARTYQPSSVRKLTGRSLGGVQARAIEWLWTGWIPQGYITIFAGETGAGKSTVLADITARVTTGAPFPGEGELPRPPARVLWLGSEDSIEEMTVPRLMACGANRDNVIEIMGVTHQGKRDTFSMQDDIAEVGAWLDSARSDGLPFAMLVIDPVTSYLHGGKLRKVDLNDAGQLRTVLEPWLTLAQQHQIAVVCVTHFAKDTARAMLHRVLGSAAFAQTCRSLCAVVEPPSTDEYEPGPYEKAMIQVKGNLPEHPGGAWKFSTEKVQIDTDPRNGKPITATRPKWEKLDPFLNAKTTVGPARGPKSKQEPQFALWLSLGAFGLHPPGTWLLIDQVKWRAVGENIVSESWWNQHSNKYLDKWNDAGTWKCRPKGQPTP